MATVIRDLSLASGYWAAVWTLCVMPDVHVICDAPVGCFNLVATAVPDYTDAIPHIENITPSVITESEVGSHGTGAAVRRTYEQLCAANMLDGKQVIIVSTAESEMIGADHSALAPTLGHAAIFYFSNSLAEDEWAGRDRVLRWLWEQYGNQGSTVSQKQGQRLVNIIGPTYGCFNSASDLEELKRLIQGAGGRINLVYPFEARLVDTPELAHADVNVVLYPEFGQGLADLLGKPILFAPYGMRETSDFLRELGSCLGTGDIAEAFIAHEKRTTLQAIWDLWCGPQGDWFGTTDVGIVAGRGLAEGLTRFLGDELGMPLAFVSARPARPADMDNTAIRTELHRKAPAFLFGSVNERIYLAEAGVRYTTFVPAAFPGAYVRRAVGTPFLGYRGAVYLMQEIVNGLYNTLFSFLPVDSAFSGGAAAGKAAPSNMPWHADAKQRLDAALEALPFIPRISASRNIQMRVEALAQNRKLSEVTEALVAEILAAGSG